MSRSGSSPTLQRCGKQLQARARRLAAGVRRRKQQRGARHAQRCDAVQREARRGVVRKGREADRHASSLLQRGALERQPASQRGSRGLERARGIRRAASTHYVSEAEVRWHGAEKGARCSARILKIGKLCRSAGVSGRGV